MNEEKTLLDEFAMAALNSKLRRHPATNEKELAEWCYKVAAEMMAIRKTYINIRLQQEGFENRHQNIGTA